MDEIWKDIYFEENGVIYDYRGLYQVSNLGRVKSLNYKHTGQEKVLKAGYETGGYLKVALYKNGKKKRFKVHRLVAQMFIENDNPLIKTQVNHIDENKSNNCSTNLEWCTHEYNNNHGTRNQRISKAVIGINIKNPTFTVEYSSMLQAEKDGFNVGHICDCCKGNQKSHKGYYWVYKEDFEKFITELLKSL